MHEPLSDRNKPRAWQVGALCRAIADSLDARFNPVTVVGELSGFTRAASGHCYFSLKDAAGQLRCAMFRRAALLLDFNPRDGELVELRARLGLYEPRGELQLVVESMSRAGHGTLFEQFLQIKARLEQEGLFDPARKRPVLPMPRMIGVVTSTGAAAWHDTMTALRRRVPHIPVVLAAASVQGTGAPAELCQALQALYDQVRLGLPIDAILLVRGGGSMEDLWAFNDEHLARTLAQSPVPTVSGVGHETDFTIADFVADLRAPTPTAAAELAAVPGDNLDTLLQDTVQRVRQATLRRLDGLAQHLDRASSHLAKPSVLVERQQAHLARLAQRLAHGTGRQLQGQRSKLQWHNLGIPKTVSAALQMQQARLQQTTGRLNALDPHLVLRRGYAWLTLADGQPITRTAQVKPGQALTATLGDGMVDVQVTHTRPI